MLDVQSLSAAYGDHRVLDRVSLQVGPGEVVGLLGPNGAGKSTLIRAISGVLKPLSGSVRIAGKDLSGMNPRQRARCLSVVPQARNLPGAFTVYQVVLLGRTPHLDWLGRASQADHARVMAALDQTRLTDLAERPVSRLSGGEQQRVLLARALVQETPVLLMDEPTTHLDLQHQSALLNLARQLAAERRMAVLMALHDLNLAALYSHRVALLRGGRVFASGSPDSVLTEANLAAVYNIPVHIMRHPNYGTPLILPDGLGGEVLPEVRSGERPEPPDF